MAAGDTQIPPGFALTRLDDLAALLAGQPAPPPEPGRTGDAWTGLSAANAMLTAELGNQDVSREHLADGTRQTSHRPPASPGPRRPPGLHVCPDSGLPPGDGPHRRQPRHRARRAALVSLARPGWLFRRAAVLRAGRASIRSGRENAGVGASVRNRTRLQACLRPGGLSPRPLVKTGT